MRFYLSQNRDVIQNHGNTKPPERGQGECKEMRRVRRRRRIEHVGVIAVRTDCNAVPHEWLVLYVTLQGKTAEQFSRHKPGNHCRHGPNLPPEYWPRFGSHRNNTRVWTACFAGCQQCPYCQRSQGGRRKDHVRSAVIFPHCCNGIFWHLAWHFLSAVQFWGQRLHSRTFPAQVPHPRQSYPNTKGEFWVRMCLAVLTVHRRPRERTRTTEMGIRKVPMPTRGPCIICRYTQKRRLTCGTLVFRHTCVCTANFGRERGKGVQCRRGGVHQVAHVCG